MHFRVPAETRTNETRVAASPATVKKFVSQGHRTTVQSGAGLSASFIENAYAIADAERVDANTAFTAAIVVKVPSPSEAESPLLRLSSVLAGMHDPSNTDNIGRLAAGLESIATINRLRAVVEASDARPVIRRRSNRWARSSSTCSSKPMKIAGRRRASAAMRVGCRQVGSHDTRHRFTRAHIVACTNLASMVVADDSAFYARNLLDFLKLTITKESHAQLHRPAIPQPGLTTLRALSD